MPKSARLSQSSRLALGSPAASPISSAQVAIRVRDERLSLPRILPMCASTVRSLKTSSLAISRLEFPQATHLATSRSRAVRPPYRALAAWDVVGSREDGAPGAEGAISAEPRAKARSTLMRLPSFQAASSAGALNRPRTSCAHLSQSGASDQWILTPARSDTASAAPSNCVAASKCPASQRTCASPTMAADRLLSSPVRRA